MPESKIIPKINARRFIDISPDRVPKFVNQSDADRHLSETMRGLQRQFTPDHKQATEDPRHALRRVGFIVDAK